MLGLANERQRQIDHSGIQGKDALLQLCDLRFVSVEATSLDDKFLSQCAVNTPVALLVRFGQVVASYPRVNAQMVEMLLARLQTNLDVE